MALSDLAVFSEYAYLGLQESLDYNIDLFNAAASGALVLRAVSHQGDWSDEAFWKRIDGLVRRRNAYGTGAVAAVNLQQIVDTMVKVAAGTPPVNVPPGQFEWIRRNPQEGGALYGRQLAPDMLADMLDTGIMGFVAATTAVGAAVKVTDPTNPLDWAMFNTAQALFGDRFNAIRVWVMHSAPLFGLWGNALLNAEGLFTFGTVNVRRDPFGRPLVISDAPSLVEANGGGAGINSYYSMGLTAGAIMVDQNDDFTSNTETINGQENIQRTIQSEWSFNLGIKGYAWDKTTGGKSPNDAALATGANWDKIVTSTKDLAGVLVESGA